MGIATRQKEEDWIPLDDRIWGIEGSYYDKREAKGYDADEELYFVQYIPDRRFGSWWKILAKVLSPFFDAEDLMCETPEPLPKSMIQDQRTPDSEADGVPKFKKALVRDKNGNQPYQSRFEEELGKDLQAMAAQKNQKEAEKLRESVKRHNERRRSEKESNSSNNGSSGFPEV